MPATSETRGPIENRDGFSIREDHTTFTILKSGKVLAEPDDAAFYLIEEKNYPQGIKDELARRRGEVPSTLPKVSAQLSEQAEKCMPYLRLQDIGSAQLADIKCARVMDWLSRGGQRSGIFRFVLEQGDNGPPLQSEIVLLKQLLSERGFKIQQGLPQTTPDCLGQPDPPITYQPWTISW